MLLPTQDRRGSRCVQSTEYWADANRNEDRTGTGQRPEPSPRTSPSASPATGSPSAAAVYPSPTSERTPDTFAPSTDERRVATDAGSPCIDATGGPAPYRGSPRSCGLTFPDRAPPRPREK